MTAECISLLIPVYNEKGNIAACLRGLSKALQGLEHEILVCYDFDEDNTLEAIAAMEDRPAAVKLVRNTLGRGATCAIRAGIQAARGDVLVTTMADLSDPPELIPLMARKIREEGADVVSGSRYMKGGSQTGGPPLKAFLSRMAGLSLHWVAGVTTHDSTTNFRAYSRRYLERIRIESKSGMELALELTVKAHLGGFKVDEVPSSWKDRSAGESRFRVWKWLPGYLRWYLLAMGDSLFVWALLIAMTVGTMIFAVRNAPVAPFWDEWSYVPVLAGREPFSLDWLWAQHFEHRIPLAKLLYVGIARISGADPRCLTAFITLLLALSSALLVRALLKFRGKTLWTDAFVPLLFLHWDHWENLTWPFQIAFALHAFAISLSVSLILRLKRPPIGAEAIPIGVCLLMLPLCGGSALPFVALLAPWWIWAASREGRRNAIACSGAALLLTAIYFIGYRRLSDGPPSPGAGASLKVALEFLTGSMGFQGNRHWPATGVISLIALLGSAGLLLGGTRGTRKLPASGLLVTLVALLGLSVLIGNARAGMSPYAGFFDRYVTLSCLFPFTVYSSLEFVWPPVVGRTLRTLLVLLMALLVRLNADHASDLLAQRRLANETLLRDTRAGLPLPLLARKHASWHPGSVETFESQLGTLAEARLSLFRSAPMDPFALRWTRGIVPLEDGRIAADLAPGTVFTPDLPPGVQEVRIDFGRLSPTTGEVRFKATRSAGTGTPETIWSATLGGDPKLHGRDQFKVRIGEGATLGITAESINPEARFWILLEFPR